jgi:hypothetical protein
MLDNSEEKGKSSYANVDEIGASLISDKDGK